MTDSAEAKPVKPSQVHQDVIDIVVTAHKHGATDMTAAEIQKAYEERVTNRRIKDGPFARVMFEIASAGWLLRADKKRPSRIGNGSGPAVYAYRAPCAQSVSTAPVLAESSFY